MHYLLVDFHTVVMAGIISSTCFSTSFPTQFSLNGLKHVKPPGGPLGILLPLYMETILPKQMKAAFALQVTKPSFHDRPPTLTTYLLL